MESNYKLYQQIANRFKEQMGNGRYKVGDMLPAERILAEQLEVSRTVIREAMIMLEVEGFIEVRKGSGIRVVSIEGNRTTISESTSSQFANSNYGPFELLQARQLFESNIAEFAAMQATKQDLVALMKIQEQAKNDEYSRDSHWDSEFHIQLARCTQNSAIVDVAETLCRHREDNPYWKKLHEHIHDDQIRNWYHEHEHIVKALIQRDGKAAKQAVWQHIENTKQMLFDASSDDYDRFLFAENPLTDFSQ
ncbi:MULTISPECIES: GntR family transcriptional regulator [Vibrio]|uniref:GntR family transcriptional regulator n=2 Tax=Vibrio TaxID=662 RepID=A0A7X4RU56_9VIBR|nr:MULTISPECIES: GntR family transcriptional regulator [Vibrio]MBF9003393.1 GntR family transcriptional regulator [Vibrio nitrifigilis]MZI93158.1 GntR family transcriptional regulator [Vibrio eleionomae]